MVNLVHREGTNLAMTSGRLAGEAIVEAKLKNDFSRETLQLYDRKIRSSFIEKDLKKYKGMHELLKEQDPELLFDKLPSALNEAAYQMLLVDGLSKAQKQKMAIKLMKDAAGGTMNLLKLGYKGWRAMNG
jgi:electron transfer flavoprotein-quinone oxidoreductase